MTSPKDSYGDAIKKVGGGGLKVGSVTFNTAALKVEDSSLTLEVSGDSDTGTIKVKDFISSFNDDAKNKNFDNFSSIKINEQGTFDNDTHVATFNVQFTLKVDISRNFALHNTSLWAE